MKRFAALVGTAATAAVITLAGPAYAATPAPAPADGTYCGTAGTPAHYESGYCIPDQGDAVKKPATASTAPASPSLPFTGTAYVTTMAIIAVTLIGLGAAAMALSRRKA